MLVVVVDGWLRGQGRGVEGADRTREGDALLCNTVSNSNLGSGKETRARGYSKVPRENLLTVTGLPFMVFSPHPQLSHRPLVEAAHSDVVGDVGPFPLPPKAFYHIHCTVDLRVAYGHFREREAEEGSGNGRESGCKKHTEGTLTLPQLCLVLLEVSILEPIEIALVGDTSPTHSLGWG